MKGNKFNKQYFVTNYYKSKIIGVIIFLYRCIEDFDIQSYEIKVKMIEISNLMVSSLDIKIVTL